MWNRLGLLAGAALLGTTGMAFAQPTRAVQGLYVGGGAGVSWLSTTNQSIFPTVDTDLATPSNHFQQNWNAGLIGLANVGWGFGNGLRTELELAYRQNSGANDSLLYSRPSSGGRARSFGVFVNALYDFNFNPYIVPYLGAGIGYAWNRWSGVGGNVQGNLGAYGLSVSDTQGSFAWQFIAGLSVPIAAVPGLSLGAEYRYTGTAQPDFSGTASGPRGNVAIAVRPATYSQNLLFTVRYNFGQQRAVAAPVAAAPAPARSFLVFFDFARDDLTARAREIIGQAAQASRSQQVTRIEVAGHTDTVGSAQFNQGLSQRRANNVAAELVRLGVPRQSIVTAAYGFTRPLVPTGPNVREPQNRRVEIVLR